MLDDVKKTNYFSRHQVPPDSDRDRLGI